ncbi:hypothetical protein [Methylocystis sp. ATCC 49242]|uniref:hypothetical protein n=1 Tax=Methylocystis sp. ATCC 49242 TaxID=622637 RepID=UPI0001F888F2|nr:hypothetical protein [Methylocystis sp. ATCC 49242]
MISSLLDRLEALDYHPWRHGEVIGCLRNPDGFEAAAAIRDLEAKLRELEEEIEALDHILEARGDPDPVCD